jgi:hypothetical protein
LAKHIDFEMFRSILTDALRKAERKSPAGCKTLDVRLLALEYLIFDGKCDRPVVIAGGPQLGLITMRQKSATTRF